MKCILCFLLRRTFNTIAGDGRYATAREVLGTGLHTIQGFYAHSNWVELGNSAPPNLVFEQFLPSELAGPTDDTCDSNGLITNLLTSGYFHYNVNKQAESISGFHN